MCGAKAPTSKVLVEGAILNLCPKCAKFGKEIKSPRPAIAPERQGARTTSGAPVRTHARWDEPDLMSKPTGQLELSDEFPKTIREARQHLGFTQEQLGKMLNEKKSVIQQLETGAIRPDDKLVKKIEKALSVKLKEQMEAK
jgi:putative transcription factor